MSKEDALLRYKASMAVFKGWLTRGAITQDDLLTLNTVFAQKYGLSLCSIYLENDLLCQENRGIYGSTKGGQNEQKDNEN